MGSHEEIIEILENIGLSRNESKVYLALLNIGLSSVSPLAKQSGLHRANVYESLKKLLSRGLATQIKKGSSNFYEAVEPDNLLRIVKEKEHSLQSIIPQLRLSRQMASSHTSAEVFDGVRSFVRLLHTLLDYNEPIFAFGIPSSAPEMMKTLLQRFHNERLSRSVVMKHIYNENAQERISFLNSMPFTEAKFLPEEFNTNVTTVVCGDEVVVVSWEDPVSSIRIKSPSFAKAYSNYFSLLWKSAK